ncbi:MAG: translocation/assembly module TamB domain-containing protein [Polyangiales bacterium]
MGLDANEVADELAEEIADEVDESLSSTSFARRTFRALMWLLALIVCVLVSVAFHINTRVVREGAREVLNEYVSSMIMGTLDIGSIDSIVIQHPGAAEVFVSNVSLYDPDGEEVIHGDEIRLILDLGFAMDGGLRISHARLDGGHVQLIEGADGLPSFLAAFESSDPTPSDPNSAPFHAVVDDMHLANVVAEGALLGIEGIRIENLSAHGRMEFEDEMVISVFDADGQIVAPWPFVANIKDLTARIESDPFAGTTLHTNANAGEDQAAVNLRYAVPEGGAADDEPELDILIRAKPLHAERLHELGFDWAEILAGRTEGYVSFRGPSDDLTMRATLDTAGGQVAVLGRLPSEGEIVVEMRTEGLDLLPVVRGAPDLHVAGRARLRVNGDEVLVDADVEPTEWAGMPIPALSVSGELGEDAFELGEVMVNTGGGGLRVTGSVDYEGNLDVEVEGSVGRIDQQPLLAELIPGARGNLDIDGRATLGEDGTLSARGRFVINGFRYGPVFVRRLVAAGHVDGNVDAPVVQLTLHSVGATAFDVPLGDGDGRLVGGPTRYQTRAAFRHPDQRFGFEGGFRVVPGGIVANFPSVTLVGHDQRWEGSVSDLSMQGGSMSVRSATFQNRDESIDLSADWAFRRGSQDNLALRVDDLDLAGILAWLPDMPQLAGLLEGTAEIQGDFEGQPDISIEGHVDGFGGFGVEDVSGDFLATHGPGELGIDARIHHVQRGDLDLSIEGILDQGVPLVDSWRDGSYEARLEATHLDLTLVEDLGVEGLPEIEGRADGTLTLSGGFGIFDFQGNVNAAAVKIAGLPPIGVQSTLSYDSGSLIVRALTLDESGELLEGEVSLLFDLASALEYPELLVPMLEVAPWRASFRMAPRDLSTLPPPISEQIPMSEALRASATLTVRGGAFRPVADVIADVEWIGDLDEMRCGRGGIPRVSIRGGLNEGIAHLEARGLIQNEPVMFLEADAPAPLDEWIAGRGEAQLPPTEIALYLQNVPLDEVPYACEYAGGPLSVVLTARDLFTDDMRAFLDVAGDELIVRRVAVLNADGEERIETTAQSPPFRVRMESRVGNGAATMQLDGQWWNGGTIFATGDTELEIVEGTPDIGLNTGLHADVRLDDMPLEAALLWLPGFRNVAGVASGDVHLSGSIAEPSLAGAVDVDHGQVDIESLGQRLDDVAGTLLFEDDRITLQNLHATDGDGALRIAGDVGLDGFRPSSLQLELAADSFPVRQEGSVIALLSGDAAFRTIIEAKTMQGELQVHELDVTLPTDEGRDPISLTNHPEIHVFGEETRSRPADPFEVQLHVDGTRGFDLAGEDLSANLQAELTVVYRDPIFRVDGGVQVLGGNFEVFSRRFDVEGGWLRFDGGDSIDPYVNLVARHNLRARPGESVTVTAGGRLSSPTIVFSSTITNDRAEIIALLVSGNVREATSAEADRQAANFLSGVASGALTLTLREEFGAYVPNITIEGNSTGGSRYGIGKNLEQLLPESVRDIILGFYVEGFLNTEGDVQSSGGTNVGVRMELDFPRSVQLSGSVAPSVSGGNTNWGADVTWTP